MNETASAPRLARTSAVIGAGTLLSRVTGFLRVSALAALGFGRLTDVYNVANSTPNIVYELLVGGILTATLVPLFVQSYEQDDEHATAAINTVVIALLFAGSLAGVLAAPWIIRAYYDLSGTQHAAGRAAQVALATDLLRWFMPQMLFYGVTALATAMLNARRRFAAAAFAPALNNVVVIAMLLAVARVSTDHPSVRSVADDPVLVLLLGLGTTVGVIAMTLVLLPALRRAGASFRWRWEPRHPAVRRLARLSGWTVGYVAANQVAFFVVLVLAYRSRAGVSVYLAAFTFFQLPHGLLAVSVMTALAPELASRHQAGDVDGLGHHFGRGLRVLLVVMIPAAVGVTVLARPLISALLDHGDFSARDVTQTADTLRAFAIGLVAFSLYLYVIRAFSSMQDTRTPFLLNVVENGINIATAVALYHWRGIEGLAWSWTIAYAAGALIGLLAFRRRIHRLGGRALVDTATRVVVAVIPAAVVAVSIDHVLGSATPSRSWLTLMLATAASGVVFVAVAHVAGISFLRMIRDILGRKRAVAAPDG
ncbi:MAG: murein biosynthesis integral membrane protein MurJ [Acidimicrobiia bacterium]|nr:murein biosynthesis integral membrane protein MurJ [Acidimicrobiia bacterium]